MPIKFVGEPFCVSKECWYRKVLSKGGGKLHGFVENFFISGPKKTSPGNHSVFQKISGREKYFMDKRGGITIFRRSFCLTVQKTFARESYCFWENFWFQKVLWMKRGVSRFSVENFRSHSAENIRGHPFDVSENLGYRKILCIIGGITISRLNIFCLTVPKNFV